MFIEAGECEYSERKGGEDTRFVGGVAGERGLGAAGMVEVRVIGKVWCCNFVWDEGHEMVLQVLADAGEVYTAGYAVRIKLAGGPNTRTQENRGRTVCTWMVSENGM